MGNFNFNVKGLMVDTLKYTLNYTMLYKDLQQGFEIHISRLV